MFLLDTDTIIYILKGNDSVREKLKAHIEDPIKISVVSLMELYYGAYKSEKVSSNLAKIDTLKNEIETIPVGSEVVESFGRLKAHRETSGKRLDDFDLVIASSALSHGFCLVTNNIKHFSRIEGLKLENWTK